MRNYLIKDGKEIKKIGHTVKILGKELDVYGSFDFPFFKATDIKMFFGNVNITNALRNLDHADKHIFVFENKNACFISKEGLFDLLFDNHHKMILNSLYELNEELRITKLVEEMMR